MTFLLDANVLIALAIEEHVHHEVADLWLSGHDNHFATCPITEGSLVRMVVREGQSPSVAQRYLTRLSRNPRYQFWPDQYSYRVIRMDGVFGHRQVTDCYLAELSRENGGRLATFDKGLADSHSDIVTLIPTR